jgi:SAM-dependent methyltransferase
MIVDDTVITSIYREDYFFGEEYSNYLDDKEILQRNFCRRLASLKTITEFQPGETALELGSAYGFFGEVILRKFPRLDYLGFDVVPAACQYATDQLGLKVYCEDFLSFSGSIRPTHVFMWDVIEHLRDPMKYLEKISSVITSGGKVYITTGDIGALVPRWQGRNWRMIHPPSRLNYFSAKSLKLLLERCGLTVVRVTYPATARSLRQIFYSLFVLNKTHRHVTRRLYNLIPAKAAVSINTFDIMFVVAQKM